MDDPELVLREARLTAKDAARLARLAATSLSSEERLIALAVTVYLDICDADSDAEWARLSDPSLSGVWDNPDDAIYDNWRELYGVPAG